ncbi:MAG: hypothetical protein HeimC2_11020 [Candidatus Heimdallarchaeota archaeon LC_2]|nr:MAG: hypothetical protein HeimC2_11020 [Candidatus Heimdallarchaeota archaeon LC_2]
MKQTSLLENPFTNNDLMKLCLELVRADKESEVKQILSNANLWDDKNHWRYYGDQAGNYSIIGNQQASSDRALVEKLTNSIDAILMRECLIRGENPEGTDAPKTIQEALIRYFGMRTGKLSDFSKSAQQKLSNQIIMMATGLRSRPSITIIDKGEGQSPKHMPNTFLSLMKDNKLKIRFVQGSYNQGSTGVLKFCGIDNLQLIITKRHPRLCNPKDKTSDFWGFSIVRQFPPDEDSKNIAYKYLVIEDQIPMFKANSINVIPKINEKDPYFGKLEWGSLVKMYEYDLPSGIVSYIYKDLVNRIEMLFPEPALPIRVFERRKYGERAKKDPDAHYGLRGYIRGLFIKIKEYQDKLEPGFPDSGEFYFNEGLIQYVIYAFKERIDKKYRAGDNAIVYSLNSQSHGFASNAFLRREKIKLYHINDHVVVIVDCTNLPRAIQTKLFMTSRDRLVKGKLKKLLENELQREIKEHLGLKELNFRRKSERASKVTKDNKLLKDTLEDVLKKSMFHEVLAYGKLLHHRTDQRKKRETVIFEGKQFPTIFNLRKAFPEDRPIKVKLNRVSSVKFETDVENMYFARSDLPGRLRVWEEDNINETHELDEGPDFIKKLWNGNLEIKLNCDDNTKIGKTIKFITKIEDDRMIQPFIDEFWVYIDEPIEISKTSPKTKSVKKRNNEKLALDLPSIYDIEKKDWGDEFDKFSGGYAQPRIDRKGYEVYINIDNEFLRGELNQSRLDTTQKEIYTQYYRVSLALISLGIIQEINQKIKDTKLNENYDEDDDIFNIKFQTQWILKAISPIIIPLIRKIISVSDEIKN